MSILPRFITTSVVLFLCVYIAWCFNENTPEFVSNRKKMLDRIERDTCSKTFSPKRQPRFFDQTITDDAWTHQEDKTPADENCEEALRLLTSLPAREIWECAGAVMPRCRRIAFGPQEKPQYRWTCSILFHDAERIDPPLTLTMRYCTESSRKVNAEYDRNIAKWNRAKRNGGMTMVLWVLRQKYCREDPI